MVARHTKLGTALMPTKISAPRAILGLLHYYGDVITDWVVCISYLSMGVYGAGALGLLFLLAPAVVRILDRSSTPVAKVLQFFKVSFALFTGDSIKAKKETTQYTITR